MSADLQQKASYLPDIHRLLPQSPDAEQGILSSFLLAPKQIGDMCSEKSVSSANFHIPSHGVIYEELMKMWEDNQPIDIITLVASLRKSNRLASCGGPAFIAQLFTFLPTAANAAYYLEIVREKSILREIICICTEYAARAYEEQGNVAELLDELETKILAIANLPKTEQHVNLPNTVADAWNNIERLRSGGGKITGLSTGFHTLDRLIDGLHPEEMITLAGRPSSGKTALAMNIVDHLAVDQRIPVGVFSMEMSRTLIMERMILCRARVGKTSIRDGTISENDERRMAESAGKFTKAPIYLNDQSSLPVPYIRAVMRRWVREYGVKVGVIDYLQLARGGKKYKGDNRQLEVSDISAGVKGMAKELGIPIIVLAQLNREMDRRTGAAKGIPRMSDLRESGSIEQDSDVVAMISREEMHCDTEEERLEAEGRANLGIVKQRNGGTGDVKLTFIKHYARFEERAHEA